MAAEAGLTLTIFTAEPGSPSEERLRLLTSWTASQDTGQGHQQPDEDWQTTPLPYN